jgi:uncharacterized Zn-binding protein involved in type VI secretion
MTIRSVLLGELLVIISAFSGKSRQLAHARPWPIPHVGGLIIGPGVTTVLIGGMPAAYMGVNCMCVGPPDAIVKGSSSVLVDGNPAARMVDTCAHGGSIANGFPVVQIGG